MSVLHTLPDGSELKSEIFESYIYGLRGVYGLFCGLAGVAGLTSLIIRHFDLNKELETEHKLHENKLSRFINQTDKLALEV